VQSLLDVIRVAATDDYQLLLEFENGEDRVFNMKPYLIKRPFEALSDVAIFKLARVENGTVTWPGEIDISPETLYEKSIPSPGLSSL
jgi:hypothetical protein